MTCSLCEVLYGTFSILKIWKYQTSVFKVCKRCPGKMREVQKKSLEEWIFLIWGKEEKNAMYLFWNSFLSDIISHGKSIGKAGQWERTGWKRWGESLVPGKIAMLAYSLRTVSNSIFFIIQCKKHHGRRQPYHGVFSCLTENALALEHINPYTNGYRINQPLYARRTK